MDRSGSNSRVAVIGGGIAGLAAAYYLGKAGASVELFEAGDELGGLAKSFDLDGQRIERYYHFICMPDACLIELARELGIDDKLRWRPADTTFFHQGRLYPFSSPMDLVRFSPIHFHSRIVMGLKTLRWNFLKDWKHLDDVPAKQWLIEQLGEKTYQVIWAPLLTMKFGDHHDKVSAAWVWHRIHRVAKSRKTPLHPQVMGYFKGGTETLLDSLVEKIKQQGSAIHCDSPVEAILRGEGGRARGVRVLGSDREYGAVVTTVPLPLAAAMLPTEMSGFRESLERVDYIGVVCLVAQLDRSISESFWCNIHDDRIPYNGVIETSKLNPDTGRGGPLVYVPNYLPVDHPRFSMTDDQFREEFIEALPILRPGAGPDSVRSFRVFRSRYAQAICHVGFREVIPSNKTPMPGLFLSGMVGLAKKVGTLAMDYLDGA